MASKADSLGSLTQLVENSRRMNTNVISAHRPHIERGLDQIESHSRLLLARIGGKDEGYTAKTQLFLAKGGVDADELSGRVQDTRMDVAFESLPILPKMDVEGFLRHEHEQSIIDAIEVSTLDTHSIAEEYMESVMQSEWNDYKTALLTQENNLSRPDTRLMTTSGLGVSSVRPRTEESLLFASMANTTTANNGGNGLASGTNLRTARYLRVIKDMNQSRLAKETFAVVNAMETAVVGLGTQQQWQQITEAWRVLASVIGEKDAQNGQFKRGPLLQGQYLRAYNDTQGPGRAELYRKFIQGAQDHLEVQFYEYMMKQIQNQPQRAQLGGVPSAISTVRGFINLTLWSNNELVNPNIELMKGDAIWAIVYLLFRSGKFADVRDYVTTYRSSFDAIEPTFQDYLFAYLDNGRQLPKVQQDRLHAEFNQRLRHARETTDPYKFALYKIMGRCELRKKTIQEVVHTIEDYIWLQFMLLSNEQDAQGLSSERYTLVELQEALVKFGPEHFNQRGSNPLHYLQVLLLTGQFERAISYLYELEDYYCEAVHFAIAMAYYGVIRVADHKATYERPVLSIQKDAKGNKVPCLDYSKLIYQYSHCFRDSASDAFQYLCLMCFFGENTPTGQFYMRTCHKWLTELILESKDYETLLGVPQNDGTIAAGCMQQAISLLNFSTVKELTQTVTTRAAETCEHNGQFLDAVKLYNIAEDYDRVYHILIQQLGHRLIEQRQRARRGLDEPPADDLVSQAQNIRTHYERFSHIITRVSEEHRITLGILIQLYDFFMMCNKERYEDALQLMEQLNLVPLQADTPNVIYYCERLKYADDAIARNLPELLLATMDAVYQVYKQLRDSPYTDHSRQKKMMEQRGKARSLMVFAGMMQIRTSSDIYAQLNKLDVLMGQ
ncbi:Nup93/Nic96-domain-containing protein [Syncephalis plumigaleata]|nr:Nup93/Nic96-domain-containing protein [Syncephalis plumigaleata]